MTDVKHEGRPICFVLMPFGTKSDISAGSIDFDTLYEDMIKPAVEAAGLGPLRADEERSGGIIHKPMFERLILSEYAVADLTLANANVYYELGVRHALRPHTTVLLFAEGTRLPFDLGPMRGIPYAAHADADRRMKDLGVLKEALVAAREATTDSPIFQLVDGLGPPDVSRLKTDVFRDRVIYSEGIIERLASARKAPDNPEGHIKSIEKELGPLEDVEAGVLVDLMLSYRAVEAWDRMIALVERMPEPVARSVLVREQYAFALNRAGKGDIAERILKDLLAERGPSSETYGILGRVYKDRWQAATRAGNSPLAAGYLDKAIEAYLRGFESDWRDAYPGVNTVTLMELRQPPDDRRLELLPVVSYSVKQRIAAGAPDYWDHATLLELAVLNRDEKGATKALADALASVREVWEPKATLNNLEVISKARIERQEQVRWMDRIKEALAKAGGVKSEVHE